MREMKPEERLALAKLRREQTYRDAREKLDRHGRCAVIRPTGFGKTGILTRFLREADRTLYLYPTDVVRDAVLSFYHGRTPMPGDGIDGVEFMTYQKLVTLTRDDMRALGHFELVATDECHKLGARETMRAMDMLLDSMPDAKLLGATATPERMDLVDEIGRYFGDHVTEPYTLHDAFQDGILLCPYYVYCGHGSVEENEALIRRKMGREYELLDDEGKVVLEERLAQRLIEISNLCNMDRVIRRTCDAYATSTVYMRFVVFFPSFEAVHDRGQAVREWFQAAYPGHTVRTLEITSETKASHDNVLELPKLRHAEDTIDLVFTCNMVNMGYHVHGLTGVVMYRGTKSAIVYGQQLGRVISAGQDYRGIVFDVVDNLHEQAQYAVLGHASQFTEAAKLRKRELLAKRDAAMAADAINKELDGDGGHADPDTGVHGDTDDGSVSVEQASASLSETPSEWTRFDEMELRSLERRLREGGPGRACMVLEPADLIAVGFEATYEELVRKAVAEPRSIRCRQAWARWCEQGGEPYDEHGRIRTRAQILALMPPEHHPLPPYCRIKHVSVDAVLDEMLGEGGKAGNLSDGAEPLVQDGTAIETPEKPHTDRTGSVSMPA